MPTMAAAATATSNRQPQQPVVIQKTGPLPLLAARGTIGAAGAGLLGRTRADGGGGGGAGTEGGGGTSGVGCVTCCGGGGTAETCGWTTVAPASESPTAGVSPAIST